MTFLTDVIQVETTKGGTALELRFSRPVTADDRKAIIDAHNAACRTAPVAPVSPDATGKCGELVTIKVLPDQTELVTRSQAEELLTAEHKGKRFWQNEYTQKCKLLLKAEADNAALTARVKELEAEIDLTAKQTSEVVDRMSDDCLSLKAELYQAVGVIKDRSSEYEALGAKLAAAENGVRYALANLRMNKSDEAFLAAVLGGKTS